MLEKDVKEVLGGDILAEASVKKEGRKRTPAEARAQAKYAKKATTCFTIKLMNRRDAHVIATLRRIPNRSEFLRRAVKRAEEEGEL